MFQPSASADKLLRLTALNHKIIQIINLKTNEVMAHAKEYYAGFFNANLEFMRF